MKSESLSFSLCVPPSPPSSLDIIAKDRRKYAGKQIHATRSRYANSRTRPTSTLLDSSPGLFVPLLLLLSPLPLDQDRQEMPQIEVWPHTLEEEKLSVLVALPQHEVAQPLYSARSNKHVQGWISSCVHVVCQRLRANGFGVGISRSVRRRRPRRRVGQMQC